VSFLAEYFAGEKPIRMTFTRSLYLSIVVHALIFGSAVAVAQYGIMTSACHRDALMVSLVAPVQGTSGGSRSANSQPRAHDLNVPAEVRKPEAPVVEQDTAHAGQSTPAAVSGETANAADSGAMSPDIGAAGDASAGQVPSASLALIQEAIERAKSYPRLARERGIEGVVHLRFRLNASRGVETVQVLKSSGHEILDTASVRAVYRAAPMPSVNGWVEMPMKYVLK